MIWRSFPQPRLALAALVALSLVAGAARAGAQTNTVSAASPASCVTSVHNCATVPVQISRTDATALLAFSVTFTLSPELSLCTPGAGVTEGTYLSSASPSTQFILRDRGNGTYTADGTILGQSNCGNATQASGTLFDIHVTNAGGSGTGSVTVTSVTLRDCSNATLSSTIGSAASVTIDLNPVTVDPIPAQTVSETALLTVTPNVTISSCATGPATWTATGLPSGAAIDPGTGVVTWTPNCSAYENGPDYGPVTVTAHAASGETGSASFSIHVTDNPGTVTVMLVNPPSVEEQSALAMAAPSAMLAGCASGAVTWSITPALPSGAGLSPTTGVVTWTPSCGQAGSYGPFALKATAGTGEFGTSPLTLVVTHKAGTVSVAAISDQTVAETSLLTVTPSPTLTDCAAGPVSWTATGLPTGAAIDPGTGVVTWTPDCTAAEVGGGLYGPVSVTAHAATGEMGSTSFSIHVTDTPVAIAAVSGLTGSTVASGNGNSGTTGIQVQFTPPSGASAIEVYRAPFGNYPEYDDAPNAGAAPATPSYPPGAPWVLTGVTASGQTDTPPSRDFWYYVAFAKNVCGEVSNASALSSGTLNYHLGDVSNGFVIGTGDNLVSTVDITLLGAHYGLTGSAVAPYGYLDVGPTTTNWVDGRPTTDDAIDFEDLVIFALNYGQVSAPDKLRDPVASASGPDEVTLESPAQVAMGDAVEARLTLHGAGDLAALSTELSWDASVVTPVASKAGDWLLGMGGVALSSRPGTVDAAALGARVLKGDGALASVSFRVLAPGDPGIRLLRVEGRDTKNQNVQVNMTQAPSASAVPTATRIDGAAPNPTHQATSVSFSLARGGAIDLSVYAVGGRLVNTLVHESREPGNYHVTWSGLDQSGKRAGAGIYFLRLTAPQGQFTRTLTLVN